jgi:hypothetical protein
MQPRLAPYLAFALTLAASAARACPTCKDAFGNSPQTAGLANGFYYTILLMLGIIFSMVGLLIYKIVREARKDTPTHGNPRPL